MHDYLFLVISSFAKVFFVSFVVWMIALVVLMFRELFSPGELTLRAYLVKVTRALLLSFEFVAYSAVVILLIMTLVTRNYVAYGISTAVAAFLSSIYLIVRKQTVGFCTTQKERSIQKE